MAYDVTQYPEGFEKIRDEELSFLPDDPVVKQVFMDNLVNFMLTR